jgi:ribose transport system substrate-binding protein
MRRFTIFAAALILVAGLAPGRAADFHGFDPDRVTGEAPSADQLKAMVADAMAKTPPRNGQHYVFGYTMWGGNSPFSQLNRQGLEALAKAAGIELLVADNEWDPSRNVANVQSFAQRNVDAVINSLLDLQFGAAVLQPLKEKGIPVVSLDIPIVGSQWFGVNNARAGFTAGAYLAESAVKRFGKDAALEGTLVIAAFPLVGPNGLVRNLSEEWGFRSVLPEIAADHVVWLDMQGTADSGFAQMNNLLGRLDPSKPIYVASFSDEQLAGALRAVAVAGRADRTLAVGMGGERLDALAADPSFIATVSFFPERYATGALPAALALLAGRTLPTSIFAYSGLVLPDTVCKVDPAQPCRARPDWQAEGVTIDEAAFRAYVEMLHKRADLTDYQMLLPAIGG